MSWRSGAGGPETSRSIVWGYNMAERRKWRCWNCQRSKRVVIFNMLKETGLSEYLCLKCATEGIGGRERTARGPQNV